MVTTWSSTSPAKLFAPVGPTPLGALRRSRSPRGVPVTAVVGTATVRLTTLSTAPVATVRLAATCSPLSARLPLLL